MTSGRSDLGNLHAATTTVAANNANNQLASWNGTPLSYDLNGNMRRAMILVALFGGVVACSRRPRLEEVVLIDKPFIIGPEWIAITLTQPVTAKWKVQSVRLAMMDGSDAYLINFPKDVPEIELVSDDGALHPLEFRDFERIHEYFLR